MADERSVLRRVAWRDVCPWLMIFKCFRLSISLPFLFLATIGVGLAPWGGWAVRHVLPSPLDAAMEDSSMMESWAAGGPAPGISAFPELTAMMRHPWYGGEGVSGVFWTFVRPVWGLFDRNASGSELMYHLLVALWNIAIWGAMGGAMTRMAVVQLGREERVSISDAVRHALRNFAWYFSAPLFPLSGVVMLAVPMAVAGFLMRFDALAPAVGLAWPLLLAFALAMTITLLGLLGGWPLLWPVISAEPDSDAFEAFSRSFSYTFQRPLQYLFYAALTVAFGHLAWFLVDHFADAVVALNHWGISWGAGRERVNELLTPSEQPGLSELGRRAIVWWDGFVRTVAQAFNYSFFFCAASAIYLLLRREVDQTDFDDVWLPDEATRYGLPPLHPGAEGIPEVGSQPASTT